MPRGPTTVPARTHLAAPRRSIRSGISRTTKSRSIRPGPVFKCEKVPGPCRAVTQTASGCAWPINWGQGRHKARSTPARAPQKRGQAFFCPDRHAVCPQSAGRRGKCIQEHRDADASNRKRPPRGKICARPGRTKNRHWSKIVSNKNKSIQTMRKYIIENGIFKTGQQPARKKKKVEAKRRCRTVDPMTSTSATALSGTPCAGNSSS